MFDLDRLAEWDHALARLEEAPPELVRDLFREIARVDVHFETPKTRKEPRAA